MVANKKIELAKVSHVYIGKKGKCMCGCSGKYFYSEASRDENSKRRGYAIEDDEVDASKIEKVVNRMNENLSRVEFEVSPFVKNGLAVLEGSSKILVVYFGEQSEPEFQI